MTIRGSSISTTPGLDEIFWKDELAPYLKKQRIGVCPSDPSTALVNPNSGRLERPSYLINAYFTHNFPPGSSEEVPYPANKYVQGDPRIVSAAETILFCESGIHDPGHHPAVPQQAPADNPNAQSLRPLPQLPSHSRTEIHVLPPSGVYWIS